MDDFVGMLERASEPAPPELAARVVDAIVRDLTIAGARSGSQIAPEPNGRVVQLHSRPPEPRRWRAAIVVALATAATVVALVLIAGRHNEAPAVSVHNPGRLPAFVDLGSTNWALTWLPPGYEPTRAAANGVTLTTANGPDIVIVAKRGEVPIVAPLLELGPLAEAHHDEAAGMLLWNQAGWTFTIDANGVVPRVVLVRLALGTVRASDLQAPKLDPSSPVNVPDVRGLDYRAATAQLVDSGLTVRWSISSTKSGDVGIVERTNPSPGSTTDAGATVILGVIGVPSGGPQGEALVSGDLPDAVGYYQTWLGQPISSDPFASDNHPPIVFLHGELIGYGIGPDFEILERAATSANPAPSSPQVTEATAPIEPTTTAPADPAISLPSS